MRILVTGGAGFIGSHLIDRLIESHHEVICLDNFYTGTKQNIRHLIDHPNFELIRHDITEPIRLEVDQIYHLACPASPVHYQYNPIKTTKVSFLGTLNMLGLAKRVKARFLLASTSEIYGDPEVHPQPEEYWGNVNTIGIRSCYDEGKRIAETLSFDYHRECNVDIRVARIFNTYGPRMLENDGRVVSNFISQALRGNDLTTRTGPINLGNPEEYTILELAQKIRNIVNPDREIIFKPLPQDDPRRRKPDITKATSWLNWQPDVPLDEGLAKTIADFQQRIGVVPQRSASIV
jgi:UDP-glucuronate decarboxylase